MKTIRMPSEKKIYQLGGGWFSKETLDGKRALYHEENLFLSKRWYDYFLNLPVGLATVYSDSWTRVRAGRRDKPILSSAKLSALPWNFASLAAGNIADILVCTKIYKGDVVLGGNEVHGALTSGGSTATGSYGTYAVLADGISLGAVDSAARFLAATSMEAAGNNALAPTIALGYQYEATADFFVVCVNSVEAFATAGQVAGHLSVVRT